MGKYRFWECYDETIDQNVFVKLNPKDIFVEKLTDESEDEVEFFIDKDCNKHYLGKIWEELQFETDEKGDLYYKKKGSTELQVTDIDSQEALRRNIVVEDPFHL